MKVKLRRKNFKRSHTYKIVGPLRSNNKYLKKQSLEIINPLILGFYKLNFRMSKTLISLSLLNIKKILKTCIV